MPPRFRIAYFAHAIRSDWNNGNAHFLRGLLRSMGELGHDVTAFEAEDDWSIRNLREESTGAQSLAQFAEVYPDLRVAGYPPEVLSHSAFWRERLRGVDLIIVHEWNPPELVHCLLDLRRELGCRMLFHDTHHRASSSPEQMELYGIARFDGVLAFGEALCTIYRERFGIRRVWTLHEAADTTVFRPYPAVAPTTDCVWIGNWGDGERTSEIRKFLLAPASHLAHRSFRVFGVRYPESGLAALRNANVEYGGYLPNLQAPLAYAHARITVHIPRQQYTHAMAGIPTIRVFEALACGIPLISAPWRDIEGLFRKEDFLQVRNCGEMKRAMERLLSEPRVAELQALRGLETVLSRHTCRHRAEQLSSICEELLH
ncbi:MAG: glycosyltransferase [Acidobacteriota bacterium]|nr:glycosyltransferase [Acidobacteriota bacterium]